MNPTDPQPRPLTRPLPTPRVSGHYRVALVCLGNICRSPMADVVLATRVAAAGLDDRVVVESCGTQDWHVGHRMDERAAATLTTAGYDADRHRAQQFSPAWLDRHDLVLAMDRANLADIGGAGERVRLFRDFDPDSSDREGSGGEGSDGDGSGREVPDPYYGDGSGFEEVLAMVERTSAALVERLQVLLPPVPEPDAS